MDDESKVLADRLKAMQDHTSTLEKRTEMLTATISHNREEMERVQKALEDMRGQLSILIQQRSSSVSVSQNQQTKLAQLFNELAIKANILAINTAILAEKGDAKPEGIRVIAKELQALAQEIKYGSEQLDNKTDH